MHRFPLLKNLLPVVLGVWIITGLSSCYNTKGLILLEGKFDTARLSTINPVEPVIRKGDIMSIVVYSDNPEATKIFNQSIITTSNTNANSNVAGTQGLGYTPPSNGYQVNEDGYIIFQGIGKLHVEGLSKQALKDTLDGRLTKYLSNPYYSIRFLNYKFTMMGEVNRPGVISIPGERINILEATAMAGDMTFYARRDSVLVIRENNNKREFARLDLTKPEVMASPYFYLQQNDIVIFSPTKKKVAANDLVTSRNISLALAFISTVTVVYSLIILNNK